MNREILLIVTATLVLPSFARADQLPGTLNFANVTRDRVVQTVPETASNEKEVDGRGRGLRPASGVGWRAHHLHQVPGHDSWLLRHVGGGG